MSSYEVIATFLLRYTRHRCLLSAFVTVTSLKWRNHYYTVRTCPTFTIYHCSINLCCIFYLCHLRVKYLKLSGAACVTLKNSSFVLACLKTALCVVSELCVSGAARTHLRSLAAFAASSGRYRRRGSCGCSPRCRWSSPPRDPCAEPFWPSCGWRCRRRPPSWRPAGACSCHFTRGKRRQTPLWETCPAHVRRDPPRADSLTCARSERPWRPIGWWWWSRRRCGGCCSRGSPATATCPAWPPPPRWSLAASLGSRTLHKDPFISRPCHRLLRCLLIFHPHLPPVGILAKYSV